MSANFSQFEMIKCQFKDGIFTITIDRPQVLNALNEVVISELLSAISQVPEGTRALVLASSGDKAFVAGADIAQMRQLDPQQAAAFARLGQQLTAKIEALPFVTVARVQGFALGGGCELAMACDVIVASDKARFGQPEVNLGLIPGFGGTQRLMHRLGPVGKDVLLTGRTLDAATALQLGLVSRVVEHDKLDAEVQTVLNGVLKASPAAIAETKKLAHLAQKLDLASGLDAEASAFGLRFACDESQEGMEAFLNKRPAKFSN